MDKRQVCQVAVTSPQAAIRPARSSRNRAVASAESDRPRSLRTGWLLKTARESTGARLSPSAPMGTAASNRGRRGGGRGWFP